MSEKAPIPDTPSTGYPESQAPPPGYAQPGYPQQPVYPQQPQQPPPPPGYPQAGYTQAGGYAQPAPGQQSTVIISQPRTTFHGGYGTLPVNIDCPYCHSHITSSISKSCGALPWMICGIICLIGLVLPLVWLGFCLIPFCIPSLYDTKHTCPSCKRLLGSHSASGGL